MIIYTIGHSTRSQEEFINTLKHYGIDELVDVRTIPRSRKNPQFDHDEMKRVLPEFGIGYVHARDLGGLRKPRKDSENGAWRNDSFRGFADYMQTPEFENAVASLIETATEKTTAIMCAEIRPWQCHRSLIADTLVARGIEVIEIFDKTHSRPHKLTPFAVVEGDKVTYPLVEREK